MSFISGRVPTRFLVPNEIDVYDNPEGTYTLVKGNNLYYWVIDKSTLLVKESQIRDQFKDTLQFRVLYEGRRDDDGISLPQKITLEVPRHDFETAVDYRMVKVNKEAEDRLFEVTIPADYSVKGYSAKGN
jgi:hypothetical protein